MFARVDPRSVESTQRKQARSLDELVGLCRGILADGMLVQPEAEFLRTWLHDHSAIHSIPDVHALVERLAEALKDGVLDAEEECDLLAAISCFAMPQEQQTSVFLKAEIPAPKEARASIAALPFDPIEDVAAFAGARTVITGVFAYGSRSEIARALEDLGALITSSVSGSTRFVVVGKLGSSAWLSSSAGTKVKAAIAAREAGQLVQLVSEDSLVSQLPDRQH